MRRVSDTGAFVYVGAPSPPNCVQDVETDIPAPGGPPLWHY